MSFSVHLTFDGQCEAAFAFYERCFAGTFETRVALTRYAGTPMAAQMPAEWTDKIVHGSLMLGTSTLAGADLLPKDYERPKGFFVLLEIADAGNAERVFHALAENGTRLDAAAEDVLGAAVRRARRSVRHPVGDQLHYRARQRLASRAPDDL